MDLSIIPKIAGLTIPLAGIALPLLILWVVLHYRERQRSKLYDTVKYFADRGMPVPRELLDPPQDQRPAFGTPRFRAFTIIGAGLGVALMFAMMGLQFLMGIGGLLVFIGLAQLMALDLDRKDAEKARARAGAPDAAD